MTDVGTLKTMVAIIINVAILFQLVTLGFLVFGDIGFDHPGRYGLDFGHGIILAVVYVLSLLFGLIFCIIKRKYLPLGLQVVVPLVAFVLFAMPTASDPKLDSVRYQHLVGKSKAEARVELGKYRVKASGFVRESVDAEMLEFEYYRGLEIFYSADGRVVKVEARK